MILDKRIAGIAVASLALTIAFLAYVNANVQPGEDGGLAAFLVTAGVAVLAAAIVFAGYAPRARRPALGGLVTGLFALVSVFAFWSGLPLVLGTAAIALGRDGRDENPRSGTAAIAVGIVAIALMVAATVYDRLT